MQLTLNARNEASLTTKVELEEENLLQVEENGD